MDSPSPAPLLALAALIAVAPISGCGGGGGSSSSQAPASETVTAPNSIPAGVVMAFGGVSLTFTGGSSVSYTNTSGSDFTASLSGANAVYSAVDPASSAQASLTITGTGAGESGKTFGGSSVSTMQVTFTRVQSGILKEAVVTVDGKTYTATFSGTPLPKGTATSTPVTPPSGSNAVPAVAQGSYAFTFGIDRSVSGCPWKAGDAAAVTLGADTLTINGKTIPLTKKVTDYGFHYIFDDGALSYNVQGTGEIYGSLAGKVTYIIVSYNGAYAGQLAYTNPVNATNDATHSIIGKRFVVVCTQSDDPIDGNSPSGSLFDHVGNTGVIEVSTSLGELDFNTISGSVAAGGNASYDGVSPVGTGVAGYAGGGEHRTTAYYNVTAKTLTKLVITRALTNATYTFTYEVIGQN